MITANNHGDGHSKIRYAHFLFIVIIVFFAFLYFFFEFLIPYYAIPSDDFNYRLSIDGKIQKSHVRLLIFILANRSVQALVAPLPESWFVSTYDTMLLTSHLMHFGTALVLSLVLRRYTKSKYWSVLGLIGFLVASWTNVYELFISHASFAGFFVTLEIYIILRLRDCAFVDRPDHLAPSGSSRGRIEAILLLVGFSVAMVCLLLSTSAGPFWAASLLLFSVTVFLFSFVCAPEGFDRREVAALLKRALAPRNAPVLVATLLPFVWFGLFLMEHSQVVLAHYTENLTSPHYEDATQILGIRDFTVPFLTLRVLFFHLPGLCALSVVLAGIWLATRRNNIRKASARQIVIAALFTTIAISVVASDLHSFTKLGRILFPFLPLILLTTLLLAAELVAEISSARRVAMVGTALAFAIFTVFHLGRTVENHAARYRLADFLMAANADLYLMESDPHAIWIDRAIPRDFSLIANPNDIPSHRNRPAILVIGPRGKASGLSFLQGAVLPDFLPGGDLLAPPPNVRELGFPYYAYLPALVQEEEIVQMLYFRGEMPRGDDDEKRIVVWAFPSSE
jgi:hypothetical protein